VTRREKEKSTAQLKHTIERLLQEYDVPYISVHGRAKRMYSLYRKLLQHNRDLSKIYDLVALRVIVQDVSRCYATLGVIHTICTPLKGRIKDYIAQPKPNGYQSLHTTVFTPQGDIAEIQIRTQDMHEAAEYGIAAHWHYKERDRVKAKSKQLAWVKQLAQLQNEIKDGAQYLESLKIDLFQNRIFIFTPRGDVIDLPENATPVDFAYHIHTAIGNRCVGAKVNGQLTSLDTKLKSGDVIEILVDKSRRGPNADWLNFVKTDSAKKIIHAALNKWNLQDKLRLLRKKFS
jgi:GTP pyrophosphokinase